MPRTRQPPPTAPINTGSTSKRELDVLYSAFLKSENKVGGGEGLVGIYGSMTRAGTSAIMGAMAEHAGMGPDSVLVDIGAGLCRPLLHAVIEQRVKRTFGVELDAVKCQKAVPFVQHTAALLAADDIQLPESARPNIICLDVGELVSLEPATHAYAAWEGFPLEAMMAIGRLFAATRSLRAITIVQRSMRNKDPAEEMAELGFGPVRCVGPPTAVYMAGSRRQLNAYMFVKIEAQAGSKRKPAAGSSTVSHGSQGLNLETAVAFQPGHVLAALGRMGSSSGSEDAAASDNGAPLHGHGLRRRAAPGRYRDLAGVSSEEDEEAQAAQQGKVEAAQQEQPGRKKARTECAPVAAEPVAGGAAKRGQRAAAAAAGSKRQKAAATPESDSDASGDTQELRLSTRPVRAVRVTRARN